jgi:CDP-glycerol glycerophosphotransferase
VLHGATVFATPGLVPAGSRPAFFSELSEHIRRYKPAGYAYPPGGRGLRPYPVTVEDGRLYVDINELSTTTVNRGE